MARPSSSDVGYKIGSLSLFPESRDDRDSLYEVKNNAETKLRSGLPYNGKKIIVEDASSFPEKGLVRVGSPAGVPGEAELIYYDFRTKTTFGGLIRGFSGSRQNQWPSGSWVTNAVTAEPHNAVKDALFNMETRIGLKDDPNSGTVFGRLKDLELRFLSPKASFRAYPKKARPGLSVRFQDFSEGDIVRYLWDFGDGTTSVEKNPSHTYLREGIFTVKLHLITSSGGQGISTKKDYITISDSEQATFFYTKRLSPLKFRFVDQTDGDVKQRFWVFGDDTNHIETDPNEHTIIHEYESEGNYSPSLIVSFADETLKRIFLSENLEVF
jgi:PKD repeat protein